MNSMITCKDCGKQVNRTGPRQFYCPPCSLQRDLNRKNKWVRDNPPSIDQKKRNRDSAIRRKEESRLAGIKENALHKTSIVGYYAEPDLMWMIRISIPFSYATSKNHIYSLKKTGHIFLRKESRAKRDEIIWRMRQAIADQKIAHHKLWIDIFVQKPNHKGDAINVIDVICDALKEAVGLDDRWFSIRRVDWEIIREDPKIYIGIGQTTDIDHQICSYCGQIKPLVNFTKDADGFMGHGRECKECRLRGRLLRKA